MALLVLHNKDDEDERELKTAAMYFHPCTSYHTSSVVFLCFIPSVLLSPSIHYCCLVHRSVLALPFC